MAGTDKIDTHGHDRDDVEAEYASVDSTDVNAASQLDWAAGDVPADDLVLAQTAAEVAAQIANAPG
jgi:hypothetical protein